MIKIIFILFITMMANFVNVSKAEPLDDLHFNAWVAYWDEKSGIDEWQKINNNYESISFFGAYFDKEEKLFIPDEFLDTIKNTEAKEKYLTIVNDVDKEDKILFKDTEILKDILADKKKQKKHAEQIISLAKKANCNGIDLDYERVFKDEEVAELYLDFIKVLYKEANKNKLNLRIILEPSVNFKKYTFVRGPKYVVMAYNLYGTHSKEDGAKADINFIENLIDKMQYLPQNKGIAFATGGCYWTDKDKRKFINTKQIMQILNKYDKTPQRDEKSGALFFDYEDNEQNKYKVWYADKETLSLWIDKAQELGIKDIFIWRLGSNEVEYNFNK